MHLIKIISLCFLFATLHPAQAASAAVNTFLAKSAAKDDTCYMTAKLLTLSDAAGQSTSGMVLRSFAPDGDRLDLHCASMTLQLRHNQEVFVSNLSQQDLGQCQLNIYKQDASTAQETHLISSGQFLVINNNGKA